jgi:hypothetical protein
MSTQTDKLQQIANAIRASSGETEQIQAAIFYQKILQLKRYRWADSAPTYCEPRALEAVDVAKSYWIARASGRKFVYSGGATFLDGAPLNNASGQGLIDCSTYIHLVMRGIPYQKSPYVNTSANATYNASDLATNTAYTWADDHIRSSHTLGGMVRYAADLAAYYWAAGRAFTDASLRKPGDLIFHSTHQNNRFMSISHVSIVSDDIDQFYNVTDLSKTVVRTNYANRNADIVFFARPDYERIPQQTYTFDPNHNYLAYPWIFGNSNTYPSGVTATASESGVTTACSGATAATVIPLVSSNYPLYLPAGTYQLSGTPPYSDRRARVDYSYWGLRLYPTDGRTITSQVKGYTSAKYSSDPVAVSQTQNHVWEKGYGATFSIAEPMSFYCNIYISKTPNDAAYSGSDLWAPRLTRRA